jgi:hypothetical protein
MSISRRSVVASAAALPVMAAPAIATSVNDPIFTTIEAYQRTETAFVARAFFEDQLPDPDREALVPVPDDGRTPEMVAAVDAAVAARVHLADTAPTTIAGLAAFLTFVNDESERLGEPLFESEGFGEKYRDSEMATFLRSIARSAQALVMQS